MKASSNDITTGKWYICINMPPCGDEWDTGHMKSFLEIKAKQLCFCGLMWSEIEDIHFNEL